MYFDEILDDFKRGKKIKRASWPIGVTISRNFDSINIKDLLANDWKVIETKKEKTWWKPEMWQKYYQIDWDGRVFDMTYDDTSGDRGSISIGNCFQTVEQAKFMVEKLRVIHELEKFAFENNEEEIISNFKNILKTMYFLRMEIKSKKIEVVSSPTHKYLPFNIYFSSEEIARKAIETIGEDRIKKYYFGVEEDE